MPNSIAGPYVQTNYINGTTPLNATNMNHGEGQAAVALGSLNPDLVASGFVLSGVAATRHNSYSSTVLADTPSRYYRLGEASGADCVDRSGSGYHMTYVNAPTLNVASLLTGEGDTCVTFAAASSQYAKSTNTGGLPAGAGAFSVECWMKFSANPGATQFLVDIGDRGTATHHTTLDLLTTGAVQLSNGTTNANSGVLSTGTPHHLVGTYDGTNLRLYVDGALVAGPTAATNAITYVGGQNFLTVASQSGATPGAYFNGQIDEVAVYNGTALSSTRVTAHYTNGTTATTTVDIASGSAYLVESDGTLARCVVTSTTQTTSTINTTYHLYLQPDGTWYWSTSNSPAANSLAIADVATNASGQAISVTDKRVLSATLLPAATGKLGFVRLAASAMDTLIATSSDTTVLSITAPADRNILLRVNAYFQVGSANTNSGTVSLYAVGATPFGSDLSGPNGPAFRDQNNNNLINASTYTKGQVGAVWSAPFEIQAGSLFTVHYQNSAAGTIADRVSVVIEYLN